MTDTPAPQIGISLLAFAPDRLAGAGTYTLGLARALTSRAPGCYTAFVPPEYEAFWRELLPESVTLVVCGPHPDRRIRRVLFEQTRLPQLARQHGVETIFFPHLFAPRWRRPRAVVTVYDLLLLSKRTDFPWYKRAYHRWAYRRVAARAAHIVTISEFCRRDIVERLGVSPAQISVAPPGLDSEFDTNSGGANERFELQGRYLLAVAGAYPHKRLSMLLDVLAMLADEMPDLHLVIAGTYAGDQGVVTALRTGVRDRGLSTRVHLLNRMARADMTEVFAGAAVLVSASEFEGFGIPVIEAMAVGCPVAASPAEAVIVVLGGNGWVARDFSAPALADAVRSALSAREHSPERLSAAASRVRTRYTWRAAAVAVEEALGVSA